MKLVNEKTQAEIKVGDIARTFRGEAVVVTGWEEPRNPASTGRVYIKTMTDNPFEMGYYPSVIGAKWEGKAGWEKGSD
jgi:hypothetical protein